MADVRIRNGHDGLDLRERMPQRARSCLAAHRDTHSGGGWLALGTIVSEPEGMWDREAAAAAAEDWIVRYIHAWGTNDPEDIRSLFTQDAEYRDGPSTPPWVGHDAIVAGWLDQKDDPGTWTFEHELTAVDGNVAIVRGWTSYPTATEKSRHYDNLMVIRLTAAGRASSFTDWFVVP